MIRPVQQQCARLLHAVRIRHIQTDAHGALTHTAGGGLSGGFIEVSQHGDAALSVDGERMLHAEKPGTAGDQRDPPGQVE